jgi:hypothetical protein
VTAEYVVNVSLESTQHLQELALIVLLGLCHQLMGRQCALLAQQALIPVVAFQVVRHAQLDSSLALVLVLVLIAQRGHFLHQTLHLLALIVRLESTLLPGFLFAWTATLGHIALGVD